MIKSNITTNIRKTNKNYKNFLNGLRTLHNNKKENMKNIIRKKKTSYNANKGHILFQHFLNEIANQNKQVNTYAQIQYYYQSIQITELKDIFTKKQNLLTKIVRSQSISKSPLTLLHQILRKSFNKVQYYIQTQGFPISPSSQNQIPNLCSTKNNTYMHMQLKCKSKSNQQKNQYVQQVSNLCCIYMYFIKQKKSKQHLSNATTLLQKSKKEIHIELFGIRTYT
eukprot:TRINITY_DN18339_c0_g1_i1.p3 TRINITY_DN18339_c0_g1~~TRINITY_DN18339_c0_g1_i1.p3  ORF type:complete len:224 (+),score=-19.86 TRINITY_DN18339_c0_g1_i1:468-1139(+)